MTRLPELHRQLVEAARRQEARATLAQARPGADARPAARGDRRERRWRFRQRQPQLFRQRVRLLWLTLAGVLASTAIALAAGGVIRIGSPVPAHRALHRESGIGVPMSGASRLVALRVADPQGGPPWGMRIVRTSREEMCVQIGRVQDGKLGELGVDGAFHDDGELHPRPASVLPAGGTIPGASDANTQCALAGQALSVADLAVPSSAVAERGAGQALSSAAGAIPRSELRNVYFGVLGPRAVSVTYRVGGTERTESVAAGSGAYLIVEPVAKGQSLAEGGVSSGALYGQLTPGPGELLSKIAYRIDGVLCERGLHWARTPAGAWRSAGTAPNVVHPCPEPANSPHPPGRTRPVDLHDPVHAHLKLSGKVVTGLKISFNAPYAVHSARQRYSLFLPEKACHVKNGDIEVEGGGDISLDRNIKRGDVVSYTIPYPFRVKRLCRRGTVVVKAVYERNEAPLQRTIVGEVTVKQPPGTHAR